MNTEKNPRAIWADNTPKWIAGLTNIGFIAYLIALFIFPIPPDNRDLIIAASGALLVGWNSINNYFYTSSAQGDARAAVRTNVAAEVEANRALDPVDGQIQSKHVKTTKTETETRQEVNSGAATDEIQP